VELFEVKETSAIRERATSNLRHRGSRFQLAS
jgi:hypothetical protein